MIRISSPNFVEAVGRPAGGAFRPKIRVSGANVGSQDAFDSQVAVAEDGGGTVVWEREGGLVQAAPWSATLNRFDSASNVTNGGAGDFGASADVAMTPDGPVRVRLLRDRQQRQSPDHDQDAHQRRARQRRQDR